MTAAQDAARGAVMIGLSPELFERFPDYRTTDPEEFRHILLSRFGVTDVVLEPASRFECVATKVQLTDIALITGTISCGGSASLPETGEWIFQHFLAGRTEMTLGSNSIQLSSGHSCFVAPDQAQHLIVHDQFSRFVLRIDPGAIERKVIALLGMKPRGKLEFTAPESRQEHRIGSLLKILQHLAEQLSAFPGTLAIPLLRELEQAIIVAFLCANRNTYSELLERESRNVTRGEVQRAEEYIEANWNKPINIEDLVEATGASARSLFRSFVRTRGYTPMSFARMIRLKHARRLLIEGSRETSVMGISLRCGFQNLGHFAGLYRETFGELPSETLARARRSDR